MNYWEDVKADIYTALDEGFNWLFDGITAEDVAIDPYSVAGRISDELFACDYVTGNASGSYYCNAWKAREAVLDNIPLLREAYESFGDADSAGDDFLQERWEAMDVTIRCYCPFPVMDEVMEEIAEAISEAKAEGEAATIAQKLAA